MKAIIKWQNGLRILLTNASPEEIGKIIKLMNEIRADEAKK